MNLLCEYGNQRQFGVTDGLTVYDGCEIGFTVIPVPLFQEQSDLRRSICRWHDVLNKSDKCSVKPNIQYNLILPSFQSHMHSLRNAYDHTTEHRWHRAIVS